MRVIVLYRPNSEHEGKVLDYAHDFHIRYPDQELEPISLNTVNGDELAKLYGIVRYPAILTLANDGSMLQMWQDENFPLMDEVAFYTAQES